MNLFKILLAFGLMILLFLPAIKLCLQMMEPRLIEETEEEWRFLALRLALVDYQQICVINAIRERLGQHPLDVAPVAESYTDWRWRDIMAEAKAQSQACIRRQAGKEGML